MGLLAADKADAEATRALLRAVSARGDDMTPSQKAVVITLRVWLGVIEPLISLGAIAAGVGVLIRILMEVRSIPLAFACYVAIAFGGATAVRFGCRFLRRALCRRVMTSLELSPSAIGAMGASTSAMLPAVRPRSP